MPKHINVDKLKSEFPIRRNHYDEEHGDVNFINGIESVFEYIDEMSSADVVEVKHGEWIAASNADGEYWLCSECGEELPRIATRTPTIDNPFPKLISIDKTPNCPNCGARMDL